MSELPSNPESSDVRSLREQVAFLTRERDSALDEMAAAQDRDAASLLALHKAEAKLKAQEAALRALERDMRSEHHRFKSHPLGYVDSVSVSYVEDWADELAALLDQPRTDGEREGLLESRTGIKGVEDIPDPPDWPRM